MKNVVLFMILTITILGCQKELGVAPIIEPLTPSELSATVVSPNQVNLTWTDKSTNETGFKIERKKSGENFIVIATVGKDTSTYSDNGLLTATSYTYRVYAYNNGGSSLGYTNEVTVTTIGTPVLSTNNVSNVSNTTAKCGGTITSDGGSPVTARGIVWSTSPNPIITIATKTDDGNGIGTFTSNMIGLSLNTTYYVRSYATNSAGTSYGNEITFKTLNVDITTGLIAYYPFNGNADDESGRRNHGTVSGATLAADRFGNSNKAYNFSGNNEISAAVNGLPIANQTRTISSWFRTDASKNPANQAPHFDLMMIVGYGAPSTGVVIFPQFINGSSGKFGFESGSSSNLVYSSNVVNDNKWHNAVTRYNASNGTVDLFIDGVLVGSKSSVFLSTPLTTFKIGNASWANIYFIGQIDDVRIYNRALTQDEIIYLANN